MAEAVLLDMVKKAGLEGQVTVDSAGISDEEVGNTIHRGTVAVLNQHGIPHDPRRPARQITHADFERFNYLLAMDHSHLNYLKRNGVQSHARIDLFLSDAKQAGLVNRDEVPDPWYDGQYARTYDLISKGCAAFFQRLRAEHNL
jgi:protein-tyrosine phosphatase